MRRLAGWIACLLAALPALALAQAPEASRASLHGHFRDAATHAAVPAVKVRLVLLSDTTITHETTATDSGFFLIGPIRTGSYRLEASRLGYAPLRITIPVERAGQDAGTLALTPSAIPISGLTVKDSPAPAVQIADTTEFRAAAVKINRDATAEELVQKLPGVTMENGRVMAQGEQVQQVLVNGRPFLGSDPTAAMRNLPAEVVDRIQVYDRMSDQAEFSGFDDGQSQKTMNFILRRRNTRFGKVYGGGGDRDRYQAGGSYTRIKGLTRLTLLGMSNNINEQNFSPQDLFGALSGNGGAGGPRMVMFGRGGRRGGSPRIVRMGGGGGGRGGRFDPSSFLVSQQAGISTTHSGGVNYVSQWGPTLQVSASTFLNRTNTDNDQTLSRQYLPPQDSLEFYDQRSTTDSRNGNQRLDARIEWTPDSLNSVIYQPRLYFQQLDNSTTQAASNLTAGNDPLSTANNRSVSNGDADNLTNRLTLRHRFAKRGRNVSADLDFGHTRRTNDGSRLSLADYYDSLGVGTDTLDQRSSSGSLTNSVSTRVAFTEPLGPGVRGQLIWNPSWTRSSSDANALGLDPLTGTYSLPDSQLSNTFVNRTTVQNGGVALLFARGPWRLLTSASYQQQRLQSDQTYPFQEHIDQTFDNVLPSAQLNGNLGGGTNLRLNYRTSSNAPSISQLQNVVDNSNPLALTSGNPDLQPTYTHTLSLRLSQADRRRFRARFLFANLSRTSRPISNATTTAIVPTVVDGVALEPGTQLTRPVNLDEPSWNGSLFGVYSLPASRLKSNVSLHGGATFTRTPSQVNDAINIANSWAIRGGTTVASNISPNLDFTLSYFGTYTFARSTINTVDNGDYYSHNLGLRLSIVAGPGIVIREDVNHVLLSGVPSAYAQNQVVWNSTLGKKFLKDDRGELRVTATDMLDQDQSVSRSVTETYVENQRDRSLGRYVQAVFTYTFR